MSHHRTVYAQMTGRASLRDIESNQASLHHVKYHPGSGSIKRSILSRANQHLSYHFYEELFGKLYARCQNRLSTHKFRFKKKLFCLDASLLDVSIKVFPHA